MNVIFIIVKLDILRREPILEFLTPFGSQPLVATGGCAVFANFVMLQYSTLEMSPMVQSLITMFLPPPFYRENQAKMVILVLQDTQ